MTQRLRRAKQALESGVSIAAVVNDELKTSELRGIMPILRWLEDDGKALIGAAVADRVVGRAAAMLMAYAGVAEVYAQTMSASAADCLRENGIPFEYNQYTEAIINRQGTGPCPMETAVRETRDPAEAYRILREKVKQASGN